MMKSAKKKMKGWKKWLLISSGALLTLLVILVVVFDQLVLRLILGVGYMYVYHGENESGNSLMQYAIENIDHPDRQIYHSFSVQNTKNGNYGLAVDALNKAMQLDAKYESAYYGWLILYYYRDYKKALELLEQCDAYTPNFSDAPMGEDIHYLKGLAHMQLNNYEKAVDEFNIYIDTTTAQHGVEWVSVYTFVNKGRCLTKLGKFNEAIESFEVAIKNYDKCSEAYYFMGHTKIAMDDRGNACRDFNKALELIQKGYKNTDTYVEYFHEIYEQDVLKALKTNCNSHGAVFQ